MVRGAVKVVAGLAILLLFAATACVLTVNAAIDRGDLADRTLCDDGWIAIHQQKGALPQHVIDNTLLYELRQPSDFSESALQRHWRLLRLSTGLKLRFTLAERHAMFEKLHKNMRFCEGARERLQRRGIVVR